MLMEGKLRRSKFTQDEFAKEKNQLRSKISDLLYQLTYNEKFREIQPGEVFGGIHLLDISVPTHSLYKKQEGHVKEQWEPSFIYPLEDSKIALIPA